MPSENRRIAAVHEAAHGIAHLLLGRPILECRLISDNEGRTSPVPKTALSPEDEAVLTAVGWAAEKRTYRLAGLSEDEIDLRWFSTGAAHDFTHLDLLVKQYGLDEARINARSDRLVEEHWDLIQAAARELDSGRILDQAALEALRSRANSH